MTRDYSNFLGASADASLTLSPLQALGWQGFFAQQTDIETMQSTPPVRVTEVHRSAIIVIGDGIENMRIPSIEGTTVGDWLLLDPELPAQSVLLERKSVIKRKAAGHDRTVQLIAANLDTAFIVTSCNAEFNVARLERYIALAFEAEIEPVVLLTKSDLSHEVDNYVEQAQAILDTISVIAINAKSTDVIETLSQWCKPGKTVAFLGSSGVGKSTLTNALCQSDDIETREIRESDARGRHTTTRRQLHFVEGGCAVLDTPGMRELQLVDVAAGVDELFSDLQDLAHTCKFRDCAHASEPGCAVQAAIASGVIDQPRFARWQKLVAEDRFNSETLAQRKSKFHSLHKTIKTTQRNSKK